MSAIAAIIEWDASPPGPDRRGEVEACLAAWKSDAIRVEQAPGATLGISLLAADEARRRDRQPLIDSERSVAIVADCRLDNREALIAELALRPDACDSDLISAGYHRWAEDLPRHLVGDFACVIWDGGRRRCVAFRDHLGVRPLFYCVLPRGLAFASDVELIVPLARPLPVPDDHAVIEHLLWEYVSTERTFWKGIARLPAGHSLVGSPDGISVWRYWQPDTLPKQFSKTAEVHEELERLFTRSVARRFDSTGSVLAHLSGGVDSSLIVCVADRVRRERSPRPALVAVSQRFPGAPWDEGQFIKAVSETTGVEALEWDGGQAQFVDLISPSIAGPGLRASRTSGSSGDLDIANERSARVILSGEGGDQLGAPWGLIDDLAADRPLSFALQTLVRDFSFSQRVTRARHLLRRLVPAPLRRPVTAFRYRRRLPRWLQPRWRQLAGELGAAGNRDSQFPEFRHQVQRAHWGQLTSGRTAIVLDSQQTVAGRRGVEIRFPFLDRDLVEFVLTLGPEHWPRGRAGLRLHREAMGSLLPLEVRNRSDKAPFAGAGRALLTHSARRLDALFRDGEWLSGDYVIRAEALELLRRTLDTPEISNDQEWMQLRAIATLETWLRAVFGYASAGARTGDG